jgi:hypothetical protein
MGLFSSIAEFFTKARGGMSDIRDERKAMVAERDEKNAAAKAFGARRWKMAGVEDIVHANTKSEARAKFKAILQEAESLSFAPRKITRLPVGAKVGRTAIIAVLLLLCCGTATLTAGPGPGDAPPAGASAAPQAGDLAGVYRYKSSDSRGNTFTGVVMIRPYGKAYTVVYLVYADAESDGIPEPVAGVGVRTGDTLSVGWSLRSAKGMAVGTSLYRVTIAGPGDGECTRGVHLQGRWTVLPGDGEVRREELRRIAAAGASGGGDNDNNRAPDAGEE